MVDGRPLFLLLMNLMLCEVMTVVTEPKHALLSCFCAGCSLVISWAMSLEVPPLLE
jgi:hypothetical protein